MLLKGQVLPPGTLEKLPRIKGPFEVSIVAIEPENEIVRILYPNGLVKSHQATDKITLCEKVTNQLRGLYGFENVGFDTIPDIEIGAIIKIKGAN